MSASEFVRDYLEGTQKLTEAYGYNPAQGDGLLRRRSGRGARRQAPARRGDGGHRCAEGGVGIAAPSTPTARPATARASMSRSPRISSASTSATRAARCPTSAASRSAPCSAAHRSRRAGALPHHRRDRDPALWPHHPRLAPGAGRHLGDREKANETRPEIEQILIGRGDSKLDNREFEKQLYILRRRMEKAAIAENISEFYVCSLSCRSLIYKGMFLAEHLSAFYPDLLDERFTLALRDLPPALFDQPLPAVELAQPVSACWRTTARSTRSWATSTG